MNKILCFTIVFMLLLIPGRGTATAEEIYWETIVVPEARPILSNGRVAAFRGNWHSYDLDLLVSAAEATRTNVGFGIPWVPERGHQPEMDGKFYSLFVELGKEVQFMEWLTKNTDVFTRDFISQFAPLYP